MVCSVWIRQWPAEDGLISEVPTAFCIVFTNLIVLIPSYFILFVRMVYDSHHGRISIGGQSITIILCILC